MEGVDAYLLDLCDAALGEQGERGAVLTWLREDASPAGAAVRVDAWYPEAALIVLLTDGGGGERARMLARAADGYGVELFEVRRGWAAQDPDGRPRRLPEERAAFEEMLGDPEERSLNRVWPGGGDGVYFARPVDDDAWDDDEDWDDDEEPLEVGDGAMPPETELDAEPPLGWRARAITLAVLEALRLTRRAFVVERTGSGLSQEALEALLVLHVAGRPVEPAEVAGVLAGRRHEVDEALAELRAAGHAEPLGAEVASFEREPPIVLGVDVEWDWVVTASGEELAEAWIARVAPLLAGWPPDVPGVDDAGGPGPD